MSLIQALPDGPLDVVGDIHGEWEALAALPKEQLTRVSAEEARRHINNP